MPTNWSTFEERYRIDRLWDRAGWERYTATHVSMDRRVAIKVLNQEMTQNEQALKRFNREMKVQVKSNIQTVSRCLITDNFDGRCFLSSNIWRVTHYRMSSTQRRRCPWTVSSRSLSKS